jgi:hypothetical protein
MNNSIMKNRMDDSYASKNKKKGSLFKHEPLFLAK